jgi:hypothetical protein
MPPHGGGGTVEGGRGGVVGGSNALEEEVTRWKLMEALEEEEEW